MECSFAFTAVSWSFTSAANRASWRDSPLTAVSSLWSLLSGAASPGLCGEFPALHGKSKPPTHGVLNLPSLTTSHQAENNSYGNKRFARFLQSPARSWSHGNLIQLYARLRSQVLPAGVAPPAPNLICIFITYSIFICVWKPPPYLGGARLLWHAKLAEIQVQHRFPAVPDFMCCLQIPDLYLHLCCNSLCCLLQNPHFHVVMFLLAFYCITWILLSSNNNRNTMVVFTYVGQHNLLKFKKTSEWRNW